MRRFVLITAALAVVACSSRPSGENVEYQPYKRPDAGALECVPNLDEQIDADELNPALGVEAKYIVSPPGTRRTIDLEGDQSSSGERRWDWSETYDDDRSLGIVAESVDDKWYADSFPEGEFTSPVDLGGRTDGIYRTTDSAMQLLGIASRTESPDSGKTLLVYEEPVDVYRFPVEVGDSWVDTGEVNDGTLRGVTYAGKDVYDIEVRALGEMALPNFTFEQVHRVDTQVTVQPAAGKSVSRRQVSFMAECFGEVARARSPDGVTTEDFDEAAEVRRLGVRD